MKISRVLIVIVVIVIVVIVALAAYELIIVPSNTSKNSIWNSAAEYPLEVASTPGSGGQQCLNSTTYIYCIGGEDINNGPRNAIFTSSPILSTASNISSWTTDSSVYPQNVYAESCVSYSGNVYCVGGINDDAQDDTNASYFAPLNNGAVGTWKSTTSYPTPVDTESCVTFSSYIYCIAGNNQTGGSDANAVNSSSVWFAPLSSSGIGKWSLTTPYPTGVYYPACFSSQEDVYCVGGVSAGGSSSNSVYYASLSSNGVGAWQQTTAYPESLSGQSCVIVSSTIYCVGGQGNNGAYSSSVFYASISSSGVGSWSTGKTFPDTLTTACVVISSTMYCVGGYDLSSSGYSPAVYYATLNEITGTVTTT